MNTQEEICEGVAALVNRDCDNVSDEVCKGYMHHADPCSYCCADQVLTYLHSKRVVIRHGNGEADLWIEPLIERSEDD